MLCKSTTWVNAYSEFFYHQFSFLVFFWQGWVDRVGIFLLYLRVICKVVRSNHFLCETVVDRRDFRVAFPLADFNQQFSDLNAKFLKNMD